MSPLVDVLADILPASQKAAIASQLADDIENTEKASALSELIGQIDEKTVNAISPKIEEYCLKSICNGDKSRINCAVKFTSYSEQAKNATLERVLSLLEGSLTGIYVLPTNELALTGESLEKDDLLHLMEFMSQVYVKLDLKANATAHKIDQVFLLFLGHVEDEISRQCSKTLRWRAESLAQAACEEESFAEYLWTTIFGLLKPCGTKQHARNSYVLWLWIVSAKTADLPNNTYYQNSVVCREDYWKILQSGLSGNSHEVRKFCLSILQLSLMAINRSVGTELLSWDMDNKEELLEEWSTYATLFEIVGIDTSLHQTQGAQNEILDLFTSKSRIHPSWGFCLLCTGFQSSMDSVRKFSAQLLLSISPEDLHTFQYGLPFLEGTFLPYMLQSSHFTVRPKGPFTNETTCQYGEKLASFLANLLHSLSTEGELRVVCSSIIRVLVNMRETFDAVKIYTALGLMRGLAGKRILSHTDHDQDLINLFENFSEGELFRRSFQTLLLKLVLCFRSETLSEFCGLLNKFVSFNGTSIVSQNHERILTYLAAEGFDESRITQHLQEFEISNSTLLIYLLIVNKCSKKAVEDIIVSADDGDILALARFKISPGLCPVLDKRLEAVIVRALQGNDRPEIYEALSLVTLSKEFSNSNLSTRDLWTLTFEDFQSQKFEQLALAVNKLKLVNTVLLWTQTSLKVEDVILMNAAMFENSDNLRIRTDYHKLKESAYGQLHLQLQRIVERGPLNFNGIEVISSLHLGSTNSTIIQSICNITLTLLEKGILDQEGITTVIFGLCESWEEISNERLKLSEKEMHWATIDVMLHPRVLKQAAQEEFINDALAAFVQSIVENSFGRRGLIPRMVQRLSEFQVADPESFEKVQFIPQILCQVACHRQVSSHAFKMESVVGTLYDEEIMPSSANIYEKIYGPEEVAGKIWLFAILDSIKTERFATSVVDCVLNEEDTFRMVKIIKQTDGAEEYVRCQLAKVILSVIDCIPVDAVEQKYFDQFNYFIENDPSPLVRIYFEWIIALQLHEKHELSEVYFNKVANSLESHEIKPTVVTIYERILYLMIQSLDKDRESEYLTRLLTIIIPAASTNKAITRHFSMSLATSVHEEIERKQLPLNKELIALVGNMYKSAIASSAFGQYRSGDALLWDIINDRDLISVSGGLLLRLCDRDVEFITRDQFIKYLTTEQRALLNHPIGDDRVELWVAKIKADQKASRELEEATSISQMPLQTKSGAWSAVIDMDENYDRNDIKRSDLIVVASLVTKAPNLGGICRLCDVLGAGLMTVFDMKVTKAPAFKSVAVTADYWMPMQEVLPWDIRDYLRAKKGEGYTLIGLEQTDKSVVLNSDLQFPKKALILLGREKEGIPGELLAELDFCVEINQVGVVRSMNIQTATAVICHAYSLQHC